MKYENNCLLENILIRIQINLQIVTNILSCNREINFNVYGNIDYEYEYENRTIFQNKNLNGPENCITQYCITIQKKRFSGKVFFRLFNVSTFLKMYINTNT